MRSSKNTISFLMGLVGVVGVAASIISIQEPVTRSLLSGGVIVLFVLVVWLSFDGLFPKTQAFPNREALPQTLTAELGSAKSVWMTMHSGSVNRANGDLLKVKRALRMVLTHPDAPALNEVAAVSSVAPVTLQMDIRDLTIRLKNEGAEVYWFNGLLGSAITIADPDMPSAWARVEALLPYVGAGQRPSIKATYRRNPEFVATAKSVFSSLIAHSVRQ